MKTIPVLFFISFTIGSQSFANSGWKSVKQSRGVEVFEKKIGKETAFRGIATLSGSKKEFLQVIHDTSRWKNWVENLKSGELIEKKSDSHHIFRQVIGTPFPMKDREAVFECNIQQLNPTTTLVEMKSVEHPSVKRSTNRIRVEIVYSRYHMEKMGEGKLRVTFENLSKTSGSIPQFLNNWAMRSYPISLLNGIQREINQLKK